MAATIHFRGRLRHAEEAEPVHEELDSLAKAHPEHFDRRESDDPEDDPEPAPRDRWERLNAECPAFHRARELAKALARTLWSGRRHPVAAYAQALTTAQVIGVSMGMYHRDEEGSPCSLRARYRIAADRFRRIGKLLSRYPAAAPARLARAGALIADGFAQADAE